MHYLKEFSVGVLLVSAALGGCETPSGGDDSGSTSEVDPSTSQADDTTSAGSTDDGSGSTSAADSSSDGSTSGSGETCDLPTHASPTPIEVTIENTRRVPIYIQNARTTSCLFAVPFEIRNADDAVITWARIEDETACDEVFDPIACTYECGLNQPLFRIEPGASLVVTWDGLDHQAVDVPASCTDACAETCFAGETVDAGPLVFAAIASESCGDPEGCPCTEPSDACTIPVEPGSELDNPETVSAELDFPTQTSITLTF